MKIHVLCIIHRAQHKYRTNSSANRSIFAFHAIFDRLYHLLTQCATFLLFLSSMLTTATIALDCSIRWVAMIRCSIFCNERMIKLRSPSTNIPLCTFGEEAKLRVAHSRENVAIAHRNTCFVLSHINTTCMSATAHVLHTPWHKLCCICNSILYAVQNNGFLTWIVNAVVFFLVPPFCNCIACLPTIYKFF